MSREQNGGTCLANVQSDNLNSAKQEAAQAQESLKVNKRKTDWSCNKWREALTALDSQLSLEKQQAERRKWLEEKLLLIGQAKEAEERRNQDMRRFAEDRERFTRQQSQLVSGVSRRSPELEQHDASMMNKDEPGAKNSWCVFLTRPTKPLSHLSFSLSLPSV